MLAALHQTGRTWRGVAARRVNGKIRVVETRDFAPDRQPHIEEWLSGHRVSRTICVLPASSVVCRTTALPSAAPEQLLPALRLQAETYLLGTAPPHRQAMAVLHASAGETSRAGLILAWPEKARKPELALTRPVTYAPDVACLAALVKGTRTNDPTLWVDRTDGSVALALSHPQGAVFRAASESADNDGEWRSGVSRLLAETALSVGHSDDFTEALVHGTSSWLSKVNGEGGMLFLPSMVAQAAAARVEGAPVDPSWWSRYGIATGALLATLDQLEPLTALRDDLPVATPSAVERLAAVLSSRRLATAAAVLALLVLGFGPLAFNAIRVGVLHMKAGDLDALTASLEERESKLRMYDELSRATWPMAKLIGDIANCAPIGIAFTSISLDEDGKDIQIQGEADTGSLVNDMADRLIASRVFTDVTPSYNDREQGSTKFKFTISAKVRSPYLAAKFEPEEDFGVNPLGRRIHGERWVWKPRYTPPQPPAQPENATASTGAASAPGGGSQGGAAPGGTSVAAASGAGTSGGASRPAGATPPAGNGTGSGDASSESGNGNRGDFGRTGPRTRTAPNIPTAAQSGSGGPRVEVPPLLTPEEIAQLSHADAQKAMLRLISVKDSPQLSEDERKTLNEQYQAVLKRMREAAPVRD